MLLEDISYCYSILSFIFYLVYSTLSI